ncbi:MAG: energy transducer TonB [Candidatus Brocadiia bacterium]
MIIRFGLKHSLALSALIHLVALGIILLSAPDRRDYLVVSGARNTPDFSVMIQPNQSPENVVRQLDDAVAIENQSLSPRESFSSDAIAIKAPVSYKRIKMLNEIIVSTFAKPLPDSIKNNPPVYPYAAQKENQEGVVILLVDVGPGGEVFRIEVIQSSGYALLDRSAQESVNKWRFAPAKKNGKPVYAQVRIPVRFRLIESQ